MDINTITVQDFKSLFRKDFPYLPVYDATKIYNSGAETYQPVDELFYKSILNGPAGVAPPDANKWQQYDDDIDNYVQDDDITRAFAEAKTLYNQAFFPTDESQKLGFLYMAAMFLYNDIRASGGGGPAFAVTSRSVGSVSESYGVPKTYLENPQYAMYIQSPYGLKYLAMVLPRMIGNVAAVCGTTRP